MITKTEQKTLQGLSADLIKGAKVGVSEEELERMDVADFGLSDIYVEGAQITPLLDTEKLAVRVLVQLPGQTEPEHWHEAVGNIPGKEETLRVIQGTLLVYTEGKDSIKLGSIPWNNAAYYTCREEHVLTEHESMTFQPGEKHWFQAYQEPVVFYSISTTAIDAKDPFTNPNVVRTTVVVEDCIFGNSGKE